MIEFIYMIFLFNFIQKFFLKRLFVFETSMLVRILKFKDLSMR